MKAQFKNVDNELWQWRDWFIAFAYGGFWLITPAPRELGPFEDLDAALRTVDQLVCEAFPLRGPSAQQG
ncbi:MAG TPA: hypothetical protein VGN16_16745 [Acidobacteriaceae bacterium]|jgi:hypothetical protein